MLRHEVGVLAQPVTGSIDLDYRGMMQQAVQQGGGHPSGRPMALDGKRQPGLPQSRAQIHAPDPNRDRAATINPDLLTAAERLQYQGYLRREETNAAILAQAKAGAAIKEIVRRPGCSRKLVRHVLRGQRSHLFRVRELAGNLPSMARHTMGRRPTKRDRTVATAKRPRVPGVPAGCHRVGHTPRKAEKIDGSALSRAPSARTIARLMTIGRDDLSKSETITSAAIEGGVPLLVEAREIIAAF
jgi:hypothetical protein